ncbi:exodeoxyribonuclease V subunit alpha [Nakamurella silvestris]|nr:exodeoxyribonuclease V subunit alpha [Nakamurella silvestris]
MTDAMKTPGGPEVSEPVEAGGAELAEGVGGALGRANRAGELDGADIRVALTLGRLTGETRERLLLAAARTVRAVRLGSVATGVEDLIAADRAFGDGSAGDLLDLIRTGPLFAPGGPLRLVAGLCYLDRYWRLQEQVAVDLLGRLDTPAPPVDRVRLTALLDLRFAGREDPAQRAAVELAVGSRLSIITGGPGTGKTTTVSAFLAALLDQPGPPPRIALTAPTGRAAVQLTTAVRTALEHSPGDLASQIDEATTIHRLLGSRADNRQRFRHHAGNPLTHDVVVVDETSMVSLTLMARLLEAVRPEARVVLLGDPDQLASVEAGAVLADMVSGIEQRTERTAGRPSVARLTRSWRTATAPALTALAEAIRDGDGDRALAVLASGGPEVSLQAAVSPALRRRIVGPAVELRRAAEAGLTQTALDLLDRHRVLCAHRGGPFGVEHWNRQIDAWTTQEHQALEPGLHSYYPGDDVPGRPLVATVNDYSLGVFNGDPGVLVRLPQDGSGGPAGSSDVVRPSAVRPGAVRPGAVRPGAVRPSAVEAVFRRGDRLITVVPGRLTGVVQAYAVTVHRSQGSQFDEVTVVLPSPESSLLTRELLYTAVTRARSRVTVVGSAESVLAALARPAARASGLGPRLADG